MQQYLPCYRADEYPELNRPPTASEYRDALKLAQHYRLHRLDQRMADIWLNEE